MTLSDQTVFFGNQAKRRTVWNLHRDSEGRVFGFVRPKNGPSTKVYQYGEGQFCHWKAIPPDRYTANGDC